MALWLAHHSNSDQDIKIKPTLIVALAPVTDLVRGYREKISDEGNAIELYMKSTPNSNAAAFKLASPIQLLPVSTKVIVAYGTSDVDVPPSQSQSYVEAAHSMVCSMNLKSSFFLL